MTGATITDIATLLALAALIAGLGVLAVWLLLPRWHA